MTVQEFLQNYGGNECIKLNYGLIWRNRRGKKED